MASAGTKFDSLRLSRSEIERLILVLLLSLALHLLSWGGYELGKKLGWWQELHWPAWLHRAKKVEPVAQTPLQNQEPPLEFVTVDQPSAEAPKNAKYYSSQNSRAANPDAQRDTDAPKLNGRQTDAPKTQDAPRQHISKSQLSPPSQEASKPQEQKLEQLAMNSGNTELQKPEEAPQQKPEPLRPRTLNQARALQANQLQGVKMRQDGGVRHMNISSLDAVATSFGAYDEKLVDAVTQRWDDLLDKNNYAFDRPGQVVVVFRLHSDGRVTDVKILADTTDDKPGGIWAIICQAAVEDASPFEPWPSDFLHMQGANYRDLRFQFNYYLP
jgi:hypothetical protein